MKRTYYCIAHPEDFDNGLILYVTDADYYDTEGCQADTENIEIVDVLNNSGFKCGEEMEGVIGFYNGAFGIDSSPETEAKLRTFLTNHPNFEQSASFDSFMENCNEA